MSHLARIDHKCSLVTISKKHLLLIDERWIYHNTPEINQQSKQWISSGESAPRKSKAGLWYTRYNPHRWISNWKSKNFAYYVNLFDQFNNDLTENDHIWPRTKCSMAKSNESDYELLFYPPYSPDLVPSDYYLFPNLRNGIFERNWAPTVKSSVKDALS